MRITEIEKLPVKVAPRQQVEAFATGAVEIGAKAEAPITSRNSELLAARARLANQIPDAQTRSRILANRDAAATLEQLGLADPPATANVTSRYDLGQLSPEERMRSRR